MSKQDQHREPIDEPKSGNGRSEAPASDLEPGEDEVAIEDVVGQLEELAIARDNLAAENAELREQLIRRQADFNNFRRRTENERADFTRYASMETVGELLPLVDDLERALTVAPDEEGPAGEFVKGVRIIYTRFLTVLEKLGLEPIESVGKPFDPNHQHAVETMESDELDDHTVVEEYRKGYNFKGKLLREAMVKVSVRPSPPAEATDSE